MQLGIRRAFVSGFCALAVAALVSCKSAPKHNAAATALKPINVVLITLDTVRADHLHCYGSGKIKTPNIDALAASGVLFEKAVAQTPLTQPSHASMFTGENPTSTMFATPADCPAILVSHYGDNSAAAWLGYGGVH